MTSNSEEEDYYYDAFISYRQMDIDHSVGIWLHKAFETYQLPKGMEEKGFKKIRRVFRDQEELAAEPNLSQALNEALEKSKYLVVICSPRLGLSPHCLAEIQKFRDLGRHDKIIALLIEGEPSESFPEVLRQAKRLEVRKDGSSIEVVEDCTPLAADLRPKPGESQKEIKEVAKLKIIASLVGCNFDDLRQRDLLRRNDRAKKIAIGLAALLVLFLSLTTWALYETQMVKREHQLHLIEKARTEETKQEALQALSMLLGEVKALSQIPGMKSIEEHLERDIIRDMEAIKKY